MWSPLKINHEAGGCDFRKGVVCFARLVEFFSLRKSTMAAPLLKAARHESKTLMPCCFLPAEFLFYPLQIASSAVQDAVFSVCPVLYRMMDLADHVKRIPLLQHTVDNLR